MSLEKSAERHFLALLAQHLLKLIRIVRVFLPPMDRLFQIFAKLLVGSELRAFYEGAQSFVVFNILLPAASVLYIGY
ncbi:MAG: hypothetical protein ACLTXI_07295 [Collinsella sp.]